MKVLFLTGRETSYPRNAFLLKTLRSIDGVEVDVLREKKFNESIVLRSIIMSINLWFRRDVKTYNLIFIGFYGNLLLLFLPKKWHHPIIFDAFVSTYDTLIEDRKMFKENSIISGLAKWLDRIVLRYASTILVDTYENSKYFAELNQNPYVTINRLYATCDTDIFYPRPDIDVRNDLVLFYGSFLPLHGIEVMIESARLLQQKSSLRLRFIGEGSKLSVATKMVRDLRIENVEFKPSVSLNSLPFEIARATVCLCGPFGTSQKAARVITGKTFQCLAMGKPIIVGDTSATRELLQPNYDAIFCEPNSPESLSEAIMGLISNRELQNTIAFNGYKTFLEKAKPSIIKDKIESILQSMVIN